MQFVKIRPIKIVWVLVLWQLISVLLMALGVWPAWVGWVNLGLAMLVVARMPLFYGLMYTIVSIPFYTALPNPYFDDFPSWRILFVWLFLVWAVGYAKFALKDFYKNHRINFAKETMWALVKKISTAFFPWDTYMGLFLIVATLSVFVARFPGHALKQILFLVNIYLFYVVFVHVIKTRNEILGVFYHAAASIGIIVFLGYVQLVATFFTTPYYFWQYWAQTISRLYYGGSLANILSYSNSWFSYNGGSENLRMFSIMPDSHSFAMIGAFSIAFLLPLTCLYNKKHCEHKEVVPHVPRYIHGGIWSGIRFSGLSIILSGTRGMWVGMIPPVFLSLFFLVIHYGRAIMKKLLVMFLLIALFFVVAPIINNTLNAIRVSKFSEHFLDRVASIYDLEEESNAGRIMIWKDSLRYAASHPFGVGYGNFVVSLVPHIPAGASFEQVASQKNLRYNLPQKFVSAHSLYLHLLVELGIAGLLAFALIAGEYLFLVFKFLKKYPRSTNIYSVFVIGASFTMLWFLSYSIFDVTIFNDKVLMFVFIVLATSGIIIRHYDTLSKELECLECKN